MSFPRYERYKDSGVAWLGEVPEGWEVKALKHGYTVKLGKMLQPESKSPDDELLPYLRASNLQWAGVDLSDVKSMWFSPAEREQLSLLKDDLLVSEGGDVGRSAIWNGEISVCYFQNAINRVRSNHGNSTKFLYYWMSVVKDKGYVDVLCNKSTIAHFTAEKVQVIPVPLPPLPEQQTIAAFLDRETGKIDALVAEQERLIELLKEKRQAVISHAVTKGLDPDAPMKDSGIEWLGEVPEGWGVCTARRIIRRVEQGWSPECLNRPAEPDEWGVVKSGCVNRGTFCENENKALPDDLEPNREYEIKEGDILMSRASGSSELIGSVAYVKETRDQLMLCDKIFRFHLQRDLNPRYFVALFNSKPLRMQIEQSISGAEGLANNITQSNIKQFIVLVPPPEEQSAIVSFLDTETTKIDTLVTEVQQAITLLKERRSALISAAVTGKIDVRDYATTSTGNV